MNEKPSNPYVGPRPFELGEQRTFAGREHETSELASLIVAHRTVLVYAQSGTGKTSLMNAGVIPALLEKGVQVLPISRVGIPLPQNETSEHIQNVYVYSAARDFLANGAGEDWRRTATLGDALERVPKQVDSVGETLTPVLVLDQFEELFSAYPQHWKERRQFFEQAAAALAANPFLHIVFIMREDYLADFAEHAPLLPEGVRTRYRLQRLREAEALLAVAEPLANSRWSFAEGVAEALVSDLLSIHVRNHAGEAITVPGEFVEPVQLQVVCFSLFENLPVDRTTITADDLRAFGNADEALRKFYENALAAAVAPGADERKLRAWFDTQLITPAGTRGLVFQGKEETAGIANRTVDILERHHLIRAELRASARWYELTHDRFIAPIRTSNRLKDEVAAHRLRRLLIGAGAPLLAVLLLSLFLLQRGIQRERSAATRAAEKQKATEKELAGVKSALADTFRQRIKDFGSLRAQDPASAVRALDDAIEAGNLLADPGVTKLRLDRIAFLDERRVRQNPSAEMKKYYCEHRYALLAESGQHAAVAVAMKRYQPTFPAAGIADHWARQAESVLLLDQYMTCADATNAVFRVRTQFKSDPLIVLVYRCENRGGCLTPAK
jgi:hypothetical protein